MLRPLLVLLALYPLALVGPGTAWAQDLLDDDDEEEEERDRPRPPRLEDADDLENLEEPPPDDFQPWEDDGTDLLGGEPTERIGGPGQDTAEIYRRHQEQFSRYAPDEEVISWEQYLERYPRSLFRDRIERRIDELLQRMYERRIGTEDGRLPSDRRELRLAQPFLLDNINPVNRVQAGFEWGLPSYMNLFADYEQQIVRQVSVHGGIRRRFTGWSLETGARWAFVKSSRTATIVSLLGDVRFNTDPAFAAFRPQLAAGSKFGPVDVQLQSGVEFEGRANSAPKLIGGGNVTYAATDTVGVFAETQLFMKNLSWDDGGNFRFNTLSFGLKFFPEVSGRQGQMEVNVGASVPYSTNYLMYHFGSIMGQVNYFL